MDKLAGLSVFVQVADSGSFAAAARALGLTASAIGKTIARLEEQLEVRLFHRNTRSLSLTAEGAQFLDRCRGIMEAVAAAERELAGSRSGDLRGKLRVSVPLVSRQWHRLFLSFMETHPGLELELNYTNRVVDMVEEGFEAAVRIGILKDSRLRMRRLGSFRRVLVAAPGYLERHGVPVDLDDLERHDCLRSRNASSCQLDVWPLGPDPARRSARLRPRFIVDHSEMLLTAALGGAGIACVPEFWACEHVRRGELRIVLADETANTREVSAVWPGGQVACPRVSAFVGFLAIHLPPVLAESREGGSPC
ncbi:LysR family transcriptional regulator [Methylobacterium nonmethylotrophicum]|uniref:LysR family transcriptional regulator n=1 Tax=Methylobacterium nonmethylotrophicum TaxID=1141884 RepID=A0A4Z0P0C2_9HYPH|nr:LysR family transcriptional regulator [Methylobacterium nonmethylotrophicum]TGE02722.1 LysR family transcriptional regulator [Methylobacterium nonmethylotrophicum]